jgi:hypothetical protein
MLDDYTFAQMVAEEVKNKLSNTQREVLLDKQNWSRWKEALLALIDNLDEQIEDINDDEESDRERYMSMGRDGKLLMSEASRAYAGRRKKIQRFKFHVNRKLDDVVKMIETGEKPESNGWREADNLRKAIIKHRAMLREFDLEETAIDRALWATLDNEWLFDTIDSSSI